MKRCPSCHRKFPDTATRCSFDDRELEAIPPSLPSGPNALVLKPLSELINAQTPAEINDALRIAIAICEAIDNLHRQDRVIGSLAPRDVLVGTAGEGQPPVVAIKDRASSVKQEIPESALAYLSPEAARGEALDARSDVYVVGAILYEMLTARSPFEAASAAALAVKQLLERPRPPRDLRPEISARIQDVVTSALARDKSQRQQSASELKRELEGALAESKKEKSFNEESTGALVTPLPQSSTLAAARPPDEDLLEPSAAAAPPQMRAAAAPNVPTDSPVAAMPAPMMARASSGSLSASRAIIILAVAALVLTAAVYAAIFLIANDSSPRSEQTAQSSNRTTTSANVSASANTNRGPTGTIGETKDAPRIGDQPAGAPGQGGGTVEAPRPSPPVNNRSTANANADRTQPPATGQPAQSVKAGSPVLAIISLVVALFAAVAALTVALRWRKKPVLQHMPARDSRGPYWASGHGAQFESSPQYNRSAQPVSQSAETIPARVESSSRETIKRCAVCQMEFPTTARFCVRDGSQLKEESKAIEQKDSPSFYDLQSLEVKKRCPTCSAEYPPTAKFCRVDGQRLFEVRSNEKPEDDKPEIEPFLIGQYRCFARLGEGGMGIVYKAKHVHLMRISAVKVLLPQTAILPDVVQMFRREAQLASSITHPNSVIIYDYGELDSRLFYLAMEFIPGQSLANIIEPEGRPARPLTIVRALDITRQVADALDAAHSLGIIHRDLKPQNVMVCGRANRPEVVKVVDFGIARSLAVSHEYETQPGIVMGTPAYMSPEQARGERNLDARSDIFSLAVMVYQMLSGSLPFPVKGLTTFEVVHQRATLQRLARPLSQAHPNLNLPAGVDDVLLRAMEPDRNRRTQSAIQFIEELERAIRL